MSIPALIEEAMAILNTDAAGLARRLDVRDSAVSKWRSGANKPDFESCLRLAHETGMDAERVLTEAGHSTTFLPTLEKMKLSPYQREVLARSQRTQELMDMLDATEGLPDEVVEVYIPKILDRAKDEIEDMLKMVMGLRRAKARAITKAANKRITKTPPAGNPPTRRQRPPLTDSQLGGILAGAAA